tara:strand:- start:11022 stop:11345 length:324 start_codon:yes stop_codon:yes gene_type:complete
MMISRINKGSWGKIRAFFDVTSVDGFTIKGFKLVEGGNGFFIGFPSQKNEDGDYFPTVFADRFVNSKLLEKVMEAYRAEDNSSASETPAVEEVEGKQPVKQNGELPF